MREYAKQGVATIDRRSMAWLRAHAHYDDLHPHEAMELIKRLCVDEPAQQAALKAAEEGMAYYLLALDDCFKLHQSSTPSAPVINPAENLLLI